MKNGRVRFLQILIGPVLFAICCCLLPSSIFTTLEIRAAIGMVAWMAFWWITGPVDYAVTGFLPIAINALLPMCGMSDVIANYASETILLLLGASILTASWEETGLDKRIAAVFLKLVGTKLRVQLVFWFMLAMLLSTILPNAVVCATITPIAVSMLKYAGINNVAEDKIGSKLLLYIAYAVGIGGLFSPLGGAMNLVTVDYLQQLTGEEYFYTSWVIRFLPIMIVLIIINLIFMLRDVKSSEGFVISKEYFAKEYAKMGKMSIEEKGTLVLFLIASTLAFTRSLYQNLLPGLKPAYAFIICAIISFMLTRKNGERLIRWKSAQTRIGWDLIFVFAGGLALGTLINKSGAVASIGEAVAKMGLDGGFVTVLVIVTFTLLMSDVTSNTATAAVAIPIVISIIQGIGLNPIPYVYIASVGVNLSFMLPTSIRAIPVGYGLSPKYLFKEGWKITITVIWVMTVVCYLLLERWPMFSTT